jgi:hypothetical protein
MTMISEYNAMQAPEANEHDAHTALADACRVITREVGLGRMPLRETSAHATRHWMPMTASFAPSGNGVHCSARPATSACDNASVR